MAVPGLHIPSTKDTNMTCSPISCYFHLSSSAVHEIHHGTSRYASIPISPEDTIYALFWRCGTRALLYATTDVDNEPAFHHEVVTKIPRTPLQPWRDDEMFFDSRARGLASFPLPILLSTGFVSLAAVAMAIRESRSDLDSHPPVPSCFDPWTKCHLNTASRMVNIHARKFLLPPACDDQRIWRCGSRYQSFRLTCWVLDGEASGCLIAKLHETVDQPYRQHAAGLRVLLDLAPGVLESIKSDGELMRYAQVDVK